MLRSRAFGPGSSHTVTPMPATMRAYRMTAWEQAPELVEVPVPVPGPGQALVRVAGCGLCHSDLSMMAMPGALGEQMGWSIPFTLGHESAGWVAALGPEVATVREGDTVAVFSPSSCGGCTSCMSGHENRCQEGLVGRGYGRDGGLAEFVLVDDADRALFAIPSGLEPHLAAPLTDAGATSLHAVRRVVQYLDGDQGAVAVVGAGGLGAYAIQLLRALAPGMTVIAIDPDPARRALATELGAHTARASLGGDDEPLRGVLQGVIDIVGTDDTILDATRALAPGGVLALVGAAGGTLRRPWQRSLPRDGVVFTFQGSDRADLRDVLALAASGQVQVLAEEFALDDVASAYAALEAGGLRGRIVVRP